MNKVKPFALVLVLILIVSGLFYYFTNSCLNYKNIELDYAYVTEDNINGTHINYTEYWVYIFKGIHEGILKIIAYKALRSYVITINTSNMLVLGSYYYNAPHYNITFGSSAFYEPLILFKKYKVGQMVYLLTGLKFNVTKSTHDEIVLIYSNYSVSSLGKNYELYIFKYNSNNGYLINATLVNEFSNNKTEILLNNQIILLKVKCHAVFPSMSAPILILSNSCLLNNPTICPLYMTAILSLRLTNSSRSSELNNIPTPEFLMLTKACRTI